MRDKSVALVVKVGKTGTKLTAELLKWAMRQYLEQSRNPSIRHGNPDGAYHTGPEQEPEVQYQ